MLFFLIIILVTARTHQSWDRKVVWVEGAEVCGLNLVVG